MPTAEELTLTVQLPYSGWTLYTSANVLGLTLTRTHEGLNFAVDQFANTRDAARSILLEEPNLVAKEVITRVLAETVESISEASISRVKSGIRSEGAGELMRTRDEEENLS